jgi:hypothetical protein
MPLECEIFRQNQDKFALECRSSVFLRLCAAKRKQKIPAARGEPLEGCNMVR